MRAYPVPDLPPLVHVRQTFPRPRVADVAAETRARLDASGVAIKPGGRYAVAVGSRGIANLSILVRATIDWLKAKAATPFIVPAMGSHGGATAHGQQEVLASYGVTEAAMGAPIVSSMEVVELPRGGLELESYFDAAAAKADGTVVINRVKPHTDYHGPVESGLMKMIAIGLGKHKQALAIHQRQIRGLVELLPQVARNIIAHANVVLGVAVVENAYDETMTVRAIPAKQIPDEEPALLKQAYANMPRLPVDDLDVLIVDRIGKDISGVCLDSNIVGRIKSYNFPEPTSPRIKLIVIRDLTEASHGNAIGLGLADIMTRTLHDKIDWDATYENLITNGFLDRGKMPVVADTDAQCMAIAWRAACSPPPAQMRIARIVDTLHLEHVLVSPPVAAQLAANSSIANLGPAGGWFTERGTLLPFPDHPH